MVFRLQKKQIGAVLLFAMIAMVAGCATTETAANVIVEDEAQAQTQETTAERNTTTFVLTGENFKFLMDGVEAPELRVKQGDVVRIEFTSTSGFHDWIVDEFGAATERVRDGESTFVEFVADQKGTFEYYCGVGSHRANGMKGNLIVE